MEWGVLFVHFCGHSMVVWWRFAGSNVVARGASVAVSRAVRAGLILLSYPPPSPLGGILRRCALVSMICRLASLVKYCIQEVYPQNIDDKRLTGSSHDSDDD